MPTARRFPLLMLVALGALLLAGCDGRPGGGPRLVEDTTLIPTVAVLPSITPVPTLTETPTPAPPTPDFVAETEIALVTPTLPPTRTPTITWTPSSTPSETPSPTPTLPPTPTPFPTLAPPPTQQAYIPVVPVQVTPVAGGVPVSAPPAAVDASGNCVYPWFFSSRQPGGCPATSAVSSPAAALAFERGQMFWTGVDRMIYVLYADGQQPAWERYNDTWVEGMPERDLSIVGPQGLWQQPRRGFGQLWRTTPTVRDRLGWALREWEDAYTATIQQGGVQGGGTIYLTGPDGQIYALAGDRSRWERFAP